MHSQANGRERSAQTQVGRGQPSPARQPNPARQRRTRMIGAAWLTAAPSKALTFLVQLIAVPVVYRTLGPAGFAAYAAISAVANMLRLLDTGIGGAVVTPLATSASNRNQAAEYEILAAAVLPVAALCAACLAITIPLIMVLPVRALLGNVSATASQSALRAALLSADVGVLAMVPLSIVTSARQAYQETHIDNAFGTLTNAAILALLLAVAKTHPSIPGYVAVVALAPPAVAALNLLSLLAKRRYLLHAKGALRAGRRRARALAKDGAHYVAASAIASLLIYDWPIYYFARTQPANESATFAVTMKLMLLGIAAAGSLALPLWPALADAVANNDEAWALALARRAKTAALGAGCVAFATLGFAGQPILNLWLRRQVQLPPADRWLCGAYMLLALWEFIHWPLMLGIGALRPASRLVAARGALVAILIPLAAHSGTTGALALLCASIAAISAWRYPRLLATALSNLKAGTPTPQPIAG